MLKEYQHKEIRSYLLTKKLPIDIVIELNDHFISQISDLQREKNLTFEEAFEKTKLSWDKELKPYWKGELNLEDTSDFMRKMKKQIELKNLWFALQWSILPVIAILVAAQLFSAVVFAYVSLSLISILVLYALYNYLKNRKDFKLSKQYPKYILTLHQHSIFIFIIILSPMMNIYSRLIENPEKYHNIVSFRSGDSLLSDFVFIFLSFYLIVFGVFLSLSAQKNYLKQIEKVKHFLHYL